MELENYKKNCMGTMSFSLKLGKMKKAESFCSYPLQRGDNGEKLCLQSSHRWAELNTKTGAVALSARRAQYANNIWLMICKAKGTAETDQATPEQLAEILAAVRGTASPMAGNNALHIFCDNSAAALV